ncbi:MAG: hypothetical protein ACK50J_06670, partial [Planctomyces sp.]
HRDRGILYAIERGSFENAIEDAKHLGLNMPEEMLYINRYQDQGLLTPEWGHEYFAQAANFIPRPLWPGKPFPGEKFAVLRVGYHRGQVAATISQGLIGQGVQNFGRWLGPLAPALLMCGLVSLMCRLPRTGDPFLRSCLIIFLMALIPNLGRDLTMFTVWPAIFGYLAMRYYENTFPRQSLRSGGTSVRGSRTRQ